MPTKLPDDTERKEECRQGVERHDEHAEQRQQAAEPAGRLDARLDRQGAEREDIAAAGEERVPHDHRDDAHRPGRQQEEQRSCRSIALLRRSADESAGESCI